MNENSPQQNQTVLRRPVRSIPQESEEKKERIKVWMGATLVVTAFSIDLFQALLNVVGIGEVFSTIISVCADTLFMVWFWMLGMSFTKNPKNLAAMGIQAFVGLIPILNTLPELTLGILAIVFITRAEDKGGIMGKVANAAQGKIKV